VKYFFDIQKAQVKGMWERFSTAKSNAAAESRFHYDMIVNRRANFFNLIQPFLFRLDCLLAASG